MSTNPEKLLRLPAVLALIGLKRSAVYLRCSDGRFPQPRHIGRAALWPSSEIDAWIARVRESGEPGPGSYPAHTPELRSADRGLLERIADATRDPARTPEFRSADRVP